MTHRRLLTALAVVALLAPATAAHADGYDVRDRVAEVGDPRPEVRFEGAGWGHGVGMSQYGAFAQARQGRSYSSILQFYYGGTSERTANDADVVTVDLFGGRDGRSISRTSVVASGGAIDWRLCDGGSCDQQTQSAGSDWDVDVSGGEVRVRDGSTTLHTGDEVQIRLTATDHVPGSSVSSGIPRVRAASPNGQDREYGYGRITFSVDGGNLGMVNRLSMGAYLRGIAEVPSGWGGSGGQAALQAQAVVARTYAYANGRRVCATTTCQVFNGLGKETASGGQHWVDAVRSPQARVLRAPDGGHAETFYSSSNGGRSENVSEVWGSNQSTYPYLRSVDDPYSLDGVNPYRSWTASARNRAVARSLNSSMNSVEQLTIQGRTAGGTPKAIAYRGRDGDGDEVSGTLSHGNGVGAGVTLRSRLSSGVDVVRADGSAGVDGLPSSQIDRIGFEPFRDDDGSIHEYATVWAYQAGITQGFGDGTFRPGNAVTRGQMASFIYRTFDVPSSSSDNFRDVDPSGTHGDAINALADAGIAQGYDGGRFRPGSSVTRAQMASFLVRAIGLRGVSPDGRFRDVSDGPHADNIHAIAEEGITQGCRSNNYCPSDPVRRGQMTTFLYRTVEGG